GSFMELEGTSDPKPLLDKIFRLAHNLKGGSRAVGFGEVAEFTHQLESLVLKIQRAEVLLSSEVITTLLRSNDRLVEMLSAIKNDVDAKTETSDLITEIQAWLSGKIASPAPASTESKSAEAPLAPIEEEPETFTEITPPSAETFFAEAEVVDKPKSKAEKPSETKGNEDESIRVNLSRIDLLNDYVGELIVLQSVVQQLSLTNSPVKLQASIRQVAKISKDIQSLSMSLRMLPVKPLIQKLQRVIRDTATALGKEVQLELVGDQLEIDKSVLDRLSDPLIHILRNAVDHGLEMPAERLASGKASMGTVRLTFTNEGNQLVVEIKDDGQGINGDVLRRKAIEKGIVSEQQQMSDKQIVNLIFHPGFSTKAVTSEISGRGVGMDVVKTNVDKVGGKIDINTKVGEGSTFRLQIPLSLAVIDGLVVTTEQNRYVIPLSQVQQTVNLGSEKVTLGKPGLGDCFELRGMVVPLFGLDEALGHRGKALNAGGTALIIHVQDRSMGLVVDDIIQAQQIVIKPLSNGIPAQKGWVGSCVLGDGLPTLILNPTELLGGKISFGSETILTGEAA
ncbi:MAG: chemotaxis protein CheA, partial [Proteobacteria bacterium]